jgi:hypothetical protein
MEASFEVPQNTKNRIPYNPAIPPLDIQTMKYKSRYNRDSCTPVFILALFTIVKYGNQPRCLSTDEWIKIVLYIHNRVLLSHKNE